jgi:hypothetical protein
VEQSGCADDLLITCTRVGGKGWFQLTGYGERKVTTCHVVGGGNQGHEVACSSCVRCSMRQHAASSGLTRLRQGRGDTLYVSRSARPHAVEHIHVDSGQR